MSGSPRTDESPASVRVALVGCRGLLGDIIRQAISAAPSIDVVAEIGGLAELSDSVGADLVLWHDADEAAVSRWLSRVHGAPRVLATVADGRGASLWELTPTQTRLGELSPAMLIDTIRAGQPGRTESRPGQERSWPNN